MEIGDAPPGLGMMGVPGGPPPPGGPWRASRGKNYNRYNEVRGGEVKRAAVVSD